MLVQSAILEFDWHPLENSSISIYVSDLRAAHIVSGSQLRLSISDPQCFLQ